MKQSFTAKLFVTLSYKGNPYKRDLDTTINNYKRDMAKGGIILDELTFVKYGKSGKHDGYANGVHYLVKGTFTNDNYNNSTKDNIKFGIFHYARVDYYNCRPLLSIALN